MDIKKSNFLKDRFKLSSFSLKIYNVTAGNRLRFCEFCPQRRENPLNSQSEARLYWKVRYIIYALGSAHVKFDVWIEVDILPFYPTSSVE